MSTALERYRRQFADAIRSSETLGPILLAVTIGAGAGLAAILFRRMIALVQVVFLTGLGGQLESGIGRAWPIPVIGLGGLLVGLITKYFAPETKGHGVPEVMGAVACDGGRIRARVTVFKILAAAVCIGSGGSAGREGPIVQIGSAFGSTLAQWFRLPDRRVILSVACGAAGGIAATFNAPLAGVVFALEVILSRFTALSFGLVVLSSATATVVAQSLSVEGDSPAFNVIREYGLRSVWELFFFIGLGVLCALVAESYTRVLYAVEDLTDRVTLPEVLKPAIGGALVGTVAVWAPAIMGTGYETIELALNNKMMLGSLFVLCLAKLFCTSMTIGSGGSGGIFAPSLFIGAMFGGAYGSVAHALFPTITSSPGAYALIGMAAVFAGAARAPVTAILILFEMTDDYRIIVPLMSATVVTTFVAQRLSQESIYTLKLRRRGIHVGRTQEINLMDAVTVGEAMDRHVRPVAPGLPVSALIQKLTRERETGYPVIDDTGRLVGVVTMHDVESALFGFSPNDITVKDICTRNVIVCRPDQTLSRALAQFGAENFERLPVIDPDHPDRVVGILNRENIVVAYTDAYKRSVEMLPKVDAMEELSQRHEVAVEHAHVMSGSPLAKTHVRDAGFPPDAVLATIRRAHKTILPSGPTRIEPGDELIVLTTRENAKSVRKWLKRHTGS